MWSLAAKAAYVTTCAVGTVLRQLVGASESSRLSIWAANRLERPTIGARLELPSESVDALFLAEEPLDLEQRTHLSLQLRWCPRCAERWYHAVGFQDRRVLRCPWHDCLLHEGCPRCGRPIDPLGKPWHCRFCNAHLAPQLEDWRDLLKSTPDHSGQWPHLLPLTHLAYIEERGRVVCHGDDAGRSLFEGRDWALRYWQQGQLFESGCALWDTVLSDHRDCFFDEPGGYMPQYFNQGFVCPVAAGAGAVLGSLGGCAEFSGVWPHTSLPVQADSTLPWHIDVPFELMRAMLRELPRRWLVDALMLFGDLAAAKRTTGRWEPAEGELFSASTIGQAGSLGPVFLQMVGTYELLSAKSYASVSCARHPR